MRSVLFLFVLSSLFFSCAENQQEDIDKLTDAMRELHKEQQEFIQKTEGSTLMHTVYFWLKEDLSETEISAFVAGCQSLAKVPTVNRLRMGKPAATEERGVVDNSYSYALNVEFVDLKAQDAYQIDPIHLKFVDDHKDKWTKVIVYDNQM